MEHRLQKNANEADNRKLATIKGLQGQKQKQHAAAALFASARRQVAFALSNISVLSLAFCKIFLSLHWFCLVSGWLPGRLLDRLPVWLPVRLFAWIFEAAIGHSVFAWPLAFWFCCFSCICFYLLN
jgi:hypothetical protein